MWVVGRKSDSSKVEVLIRKPEWTLPQLQVAIPSNYGGAYTDYSFFQGSESDEEKVRDGQEYSLTWTNSEITSFNFSVEDVKRWVKCFADKNEISGDGIDSTLITLEVWKADKSGIATNITAVQSMPIMTPSGERWVDVSIVAGVANKTFKTTKSGTWTIPSRPKRFKTVRVMERCQIEVKDTSIF